MFAGPPKFSEADLRAGEIEASYTVQQFLTTAIVLYLSPFVVDATLKFL